MQVLKTCEISEVSGGIIDKAIVPIASMVVGAGLGAMVAINTVPRSSSTMAYLATPIEYAAYGALGGFVVGCGIVLGMS